MDFSIDPEMLCCEGGGYRIIKDGFGLFGLLRRSVRSCKFDGFGYANTEY